MVASARQVQLPESSQCGFLHADGREWDTASESSQSSCLMRIPELPDAVSISPIITPSPYCWKTKSQFLSSANLCNSTYSDSAPLSRTLASVHLAREERRETCVEPGDS
jgi:hypothetical protein